MNASRTPPARPVSGTLMDLQDTLVAIRSGAYLSIAADEALLRRLPPGNWLAGSIPYFMAQDGGETSRQKLFVTELPTHAGTPQLRWYDAASLHKVALDAPAHGLTVLIVPAFSEVHSRFAREAPAFEDMYMKPLVGWIAGVHLDDLGQAAPVVANGQTLVFSHDKALAVHIPLPESIYPRIDILNLFRPGGGDAIRFPSTGFSAQECFVNGQLVNLAQYLAQQGIDTRLPLVADYSGARQIPAFDGWFLERFGVKRRIEVTAPTLASLPSLVIGTARIATVHKRLAQRALQYGLPLQVWEPPLEIPVMRQTLQWHRHRDKDLGLEWLREQAVDVAAHI